MPTLTDDLRSIRYTSVASVGEQVRKLGFKPENLSTALSTAHRHSLTSGLRMARGILETASDKTSAKQEMRAMVRWAGRAGESQRTMLTSAFLRSGKHYQFLDQVAALPRSQARLFVQDYFANGGSMKTIVQVL